MTKVARGSLLDIETLKAADILALLQLARKMNPRKPRPSLRGKRVLLLFYEPSTRTRSSFEIAAKSMEAMTPSCYRADPASKKASRYWTRRTHCEPWARM
jgi:aspartate carbamoyltransferase catalytic subunit